LNYAVDINALLVEILELIKHQPNYEEMAIEATLMENIPAFLGDPSALRQVFMNILINACHAIKDGGSVEISTNYSSADQAIIIQVKDSGYGISPDVIDRIWDPFFTTKEVGKGIGLGLALSYNIVKRHGGEISVNSTVGDGSQFTVKLPVGGE